MPFNFLQGGGEMGALIRSIDWSKSAIGTPDKWPPTLKTMVNATLDNKIGMYIAWGAEYTQIYNDAYRPILGSSKHPKAMGISTRETFAEIWHIIGPMFSEVMKGKSVGFPDFMLPLDRNGFIEECYFDFSYSPIRLEDGVPGGVLVTVVETTEKIKTLKKIKENEERFQFAIEAAELGTWDLNPITKKFEANKRLREWFGLNKTGDIDYPIPDAVIEEDREKVLNEMYRSFDIASGGNYEIEYTILDASTNSRKRIRAKGKTSFNDKGEAVRFNGVLEDITEQEIAKQALIESQQQVERLFMDAPFPITVYSSNNLKIQLINHKAAELVRMKPDQLKGRELFKISPQMKGQPLAEMLEKVLRTGETCYSNEEKLIIYSKDKERHAYINSIAQPIFDNDGKISGILSMGIDVTELIHARQKIEESERNLSNLVRNAPVAMCVLKGPEFKVEIANQPMIELWGKSFDEVLKKPIFQGLPEAKEQGIEALLEHVYKSGESLSATERLIYLPRNGVVVPTYINFVYEPFRENDGQVTGILAVAIEVTEQVEARHKIEEAEERARLAVDGANIGTFDLNLFTKEIITSLRFNTIFGFEGEMSHHDFMNRYHPDDIHLRDNALEIAMLTGNLSFQIRLLVDGNIKWVKIDGKVFYDEHKKAYRLLGTALDITSVVELQRQKDDFIAIASHELKTPLTSLKGYTQILSSLIRKGDQVTSLNILKKTERQVNKMTNLIHSFLDISKLESSRLQLVLEKFDLNELVSETINYFNLPDNKERLKFNASKLPPVLADRSKISHVIDNLISNALKYSPTQNPVNINSYLQNNEIIVSVSDQGIGINELSKDKIFQRFYRADNVRNDIVSGFGIGLYLSAEIVKLHNGRIWFDSSEGKGSTFYFALPLV